VIMWPLEEGLKWQVWTRGWCQIMHLQEAMDSN